MEKDKAASTGADTVGSDEELITGRTLAIIKPDVVEYNQIGSVLSMVEKKFVVEHMVMLEFDEDVASEFYAAHKDKPFFNSLVQFMTSGPLVLMILASSGDTVADFRTLMGSTDPSTAAEGTIRAFCHANIPGSSIERNAIHGSDSPEAAQREISIFFDEVE